MCKTVAPNRTRGGFLNIHPLKLCSVMFPEDMRFLYEEATNECLTLSVILEYGVETTNMHDALVPLPATILRFTLLYASALLRYYTQLLLPISPLCRLAYAAKGVAVCAS